MISAGRLRFIATIETPSTTQDVLGMRPDAWTTGATFRADLRSDNGAEAQYADGVAVTRTYEVRARWQAITGLTEIDRL